MGYIGGNSLSKGNLGPTDIMGSEETRASRFQWLRIAVPSPLDPLVVSRHSAAVNSEDMANFSKGPGLGKVGVKEISDLSNFGGCADSRGGE